MGTNTCASRLSISGAEAENLIQQFYQTFPEIKEWMERVKIFTFQHRRVSSLLGRSRPIKIDTQNRFFYFSVSYFLFFI